MAYGGVVRVNGTGGAGLKTKRQQRQTKTTTTKTPTVSVGATHERGVNSLSGKMAHHKKLGSLETILLNVLLNARPVPNSQHNTGGMFKWSFSQKYREFLFKFHQSRTCRLDLVQVMMTVFVTDAYCWALLLLHVTFENVRIPNVLKYVGTC